MKLFSQGSSLLLLLFAYTATFAQEKPPVLPDTSLIITVKKKIRFEELMDIIRAPGFDAWHPKIPNDTLHFETSKVSIGYALKKVCRKFSLEVEIIPPYHIQFSRVKRKTEPVYHLEGRVINESGDPISGASIQNLSMKNVIVTKTDGLFSIRTTEKATRYMVSCVGYSPQIFTSTSTGLRTIMMHREYTVMTSIDNKASIRSSSHLKTGDWRSIKGSHLPRTFNILQGLKGLIPGLQVTNVNGYPNSTPEIRIRGQVSLANVPGQTNLSKGDPLVLLNGVPLPAGILPIGRIASSAGDPTQGNDAGGLNMLSFINPEDIAEIIVLRDAEAIATYGPQAANGAILILTRLANGTEDPQVSFKLTKGIHKAAHIPEMLNIYQYQQLRESFLSNGGPVTDSFKAPEFKRWDPNRNINWSRELLDHRSQSTSFHVSVSGGDSIQRLNAGMGYYRQSSILPVSFPLTRVTQYLTGIFTPGERLSINISFNAGTSRDELPFNNPMVFTRLAPNAPYPSKDRQLVFDENELSFANPYGAFRNRYIANSSAAQLSSGLEYILSPAFSFILNTGVHQTIFNELNLLPIAAQPKMVDSAYFERAITEYASVIIEPQWQFHWNDSLHKQQFNSRLGISWHSRSVHWNKYQSPMFRDDSTMNEQLSGTDGKPSRGKGQQQVTGLYNRSSFSLRDDLIFYLSGRLDQSRINNDHQLLFSWSAAADWFFAKKGKSKPRFIRGGNLRFSIGKMSTDGSLNYGFLQPDDNSTAAPGSNNHKNRETILMSQLGLKLNIQDWLSVAATGFMSTHFADLQTNRLYADSSASSIAHAAVVRNSGLELEMQADILQSSRKYLTTRAFITIPMNKLIRLTDLQQSNFSNTVREGRPITEILGYRSNGIDAITGQYSYIDMNGDGKLSLPEDETVISYNQPKWFATLINNSKINDFSFELVLEARSQLLLKPLYNSYDNNTPGRFPAGGLSNHSIELLEPWAQKTFLNDPAAVKMSGEVKRSNIIYGDASSVTLSSFKSSYRIPVHRSRKMILTSATVFCEVQNVFTVSAYKFADPLVSGPNAIPSLRSIVMGIKITP